MKNMMDYEGQMMRYATLCQSQCSYRMPQLFVPTLARVTENRSWSCRVYLTSRTIADYELSLYDWYSECYLLTRSRGDIGHAHQLFDLGLTGEV